MKNRKISHKLWRDLAIYFLICIGLFLFFFLRNHYYVPATLEVTGDFPLKTDAILSWDSGRGFNQRENMPVKFESGTKTNNIDLPQLGIKGIKLASQDQSQKINISGLKVKSANGEQVLSSMEQDGVIIAQVNKKQLEKIHPLLVSVQLFLALLLTWLVYELLNLKKRLRKPSWQATLRYIFFEEKRWIFWFLSVGAMMVFSFWLLGQWPGAATPDSFYQLYQTKSLVLEDHHPYSHTLYLLTLMQFYDSFGSIAIFQVIATSFLGSFIFYFVIKKGVQFYLVLPFYLAFIFSIPVGLFNVVIWKDVPFSLLVVLWGFYLFFLGYQKKKGAIVEISLKKIIILSALFILMVFIRHNGLMYLFILPLIIIIGGLMPRKVFLKFLLVSAVLFVILNSVIPKIFNIQPWSKDDTRLLWKINPLVEMMQNKYYVSDNHTQDQAIVDKIVNPENLKKNLGWDLALYTNSATLKSEDIRTFDRLFYIRLIQNFPLYIGYRTNILFYFLSPVTVTWSNGLPDLQGLRSYIYLWRSGTALYIQPSPVVKLANIQLQINTMLEKFKPIFYDLLYPTIFLLTLLLLYKWLPLSAYSSFFILSQLGFWFIFAIDPLFRYLYFIYLYYLLAFPLLILEIHLSRDLSPKSILKNPRVYDFLLILIYLIFVIPYVLGGILIYHQSIFANF